MKRKKKGRGGILRVRALFLLEGAFWKRKIKGKRREKGRVEIPKNSLLLRLAFFASKGGGGLGEGREREGWVAFLTIFVFSWGPQQEEGEGETGKRGRKRKGSCCCQMISSPDLDPCNRRRGCIGGGRRRGGCDPSLSTTQLLIHKRGYGEMKRKGKSKRRRGRKKVSISLSSISLTQKGGAAREGRGKGNLLSLYLDFTNGGGTKKENQMCHIRAKSGDDRKERSRGGGRKRSARTSARGCADRVRERRKRKRHTAELQNSTPWPTP